MTTPNGGWGNPVIGGTALRIPAITSPAFDLASPTASPNPSWGILINGLAYFFGLILSGGTISGTNYIINSSGIFFYSGTPAAGNLFVSVASSPGTDGFGNAYSAGVYLHGSGGGSTALTGSTQPTLLLTPASVTHLTTFPQVFAAALNAGLANERMQVTVISGESGGNANAALSLFSEAADASTPAAANINAPLTATGGTAANPSIITTDSLHQATLINSWQGSGGNANGLFYMLTTDGWVQLIGDIINPANSFPNSTCATLPAGYRPAQDLNLSGATQNPAAASPWLFVDTSGDVEIIGMPNPADEVIITARFPLAAL